MAKSLKNKLTLVVLGRSGSGKGTQADFIVRRLRKEGVGHFETGKFLRNLLKKNNLTTKIGRKLMGKGLLFPAWLSAFTWLNEFIEKGYAQKHLVFDGAPRIVWEAGLIDEVMRWHGRSLALAIYIDVSEKEAARRLLLRGRSDDKQRAIRNRLAFFRKIVTKTMRFYKKQGRLIYVNGEQPVEGVWREVDAKLKKRLGKRWPLR